MNTAYERTLALLTGKRDLVKALADTLLEKEVRPRAKAVIDIVALAGLEVVGFSGASRGDVASNLPGCPAWHLSGTPLQGGPQHRACS